jgi:hypothetical protein
MGYMFVLAMVIVIIYYAGKSMIEQIEIHEIREQELQRAYDIYKKYPHILRKSLKDMYVEVNEKTDTTEEIQAKVDNNMDLKYFLDELDGTLSKRKFISIWDQIFETKFYDESGMNYHRRVWLSDLEHDMRNDSKFLREEKKREHQKSLLEAQEKKRLKDEYVKWF